MLAKTIVIVIFFAILGSLGSGLLFLVALPPLASALEESFYIGLFSRVLIYALAAVSLDLDI